MFDIGLISLFNFCHNPSLSVSILDLFVCSMVNACLSLKVLFALVSLSCMFKYFVIFCPGASVIIKFQHNCSMPKLDFSNWFKNSRDFQHPINVLYFEHCILKLHSNLLTTLTPGQKLEGRSRNLGKQKLNLFFLLNMIFSFSHFYVELISMNRFSKWSGLWWNDVAYDDKISLWWNDVAYDDTISLWWNHLALDDKIR